MNITYKTPTLIELSIEDLSSRNGKSFADITDVLYMFKNNASDQDTDAVLSKRIKIDADITLNLSTQTASIPIDVADFGVGKVEAGTDYLICVGVEFNDSGYYIEDYDPNFKRLVQIWRDKVRA